MNDGESEIDDANFFFAKDGYRDAKAELLATLDAFYSDEKKDDNSSICRFPARYFWLQEELNATDFPSAHCREYDKVLQRVDPVSTTLIFPSAHINSPASMFGHTFLRINSSYNSRLLSYAINYAADANMNDENGVSFAIKGLTGGYFGKYSFLPYYEKLKEYRDSEQRDIWEYDLNLSEAETYRMFRHIWELNGTHSYYYFFTENCSYNMLWLIEAARPSVNLRKYFHYQVIPLETVHVAKKEGLIESISYRASKRTLLLKYEELLEDMYEELPIALVNGELDTTKIMHNMEINATQKRYILEAAIEYLEYVYSKGKVKKKRYLELFHTFTTARATLGITKPIQIEKPNDPLKSHRALRAKLSLGSREGEFITLLGFRPAYHDLEDSSYGFLRGTEIEFLDITLGLIDKKTILEEATILSIVSLAQRSTFFKSFSWRMHLGWDRDFTDEKARFNLTVGAGYSWGNKNGYIYGLVDPLFYVSDKFVAGVGATLGANFDKYDFMSTKLELTERFYSDGNEQLLISVAQGFRTSQNTQIVLKYDYKDRYLDNIKRSEESYIASFKYFF